MHLSYLLPMKSLIFPWVLLYSMLFSIDIISVSGQCLEDQRSLLLQLNNTLKFDPLRSTKLVNWDQSVDCCSWGGVTCDNDGRVIGIDLSEESIVGWIDNSSSLFRFQYLEKLNLAYNNFQYNEIPSGFDKLTSLTYLNLSYAYFYGRIPVGVSRMTRLVVLDLSSPTMLKLVNLNLEMLVRNLTKLTQLHLDGVNISAQGSLWCQALSSSLSNLQVLSLSDCNLSGPIDSSLGKLRSLSVIRLNGNNFSAPIPEFFSNFTNLTYLSFISSGLRGTIPKKVIQVTALQTLDLSYNGLLEGSLPEFPQNSSLQTLLLSLTNLSGKLPDSMGNLKMLSRVDLSYSKFSGSIPNSIANLTGIVHFDLSGNRFSGPVPSICRWNNLTVINMNNNNLTGPIPCTHFEGLKRLEFINLSNNSLNGRIPPSLFSNQFLWNVQLSLNQFSGPLDEFPVPSSSVLEYIDLSSNHLEGPIPMSVFELPSLRTLQLSSNNFNGTVELSTIQKLRNLTELDLSYNNLSVNANSTLSSFPPGITSLNLASCNLRAFPDLRNLQPNLESLDLSNNQIPGKIPNWIGSNSTKFGDGFLLYLNLSHNFLVDLERPFPELLYINFLDLHSNMLQGTIPTVTKSAKLLDFSDNNFTSPIPADIGNYLEYTVFFSVSGNKLTGNIPESICNATSLEILDLSNNSLNGSIPSCLLYNITSTLGVLDLGKNNLHGSIPGEFSSQCSLRTLDLSGNMLQGQVPRALANCTMLEVLNLGKNKINDEFPCGLNNLTNLRVLVLRFNRFHGPIKCPDTNLSWPLLQILDLASNNFSGNLPSEYFSSWKAMIVDSDDEAQSRLSHLSFEVLGFSNVLYQDTIMVTIKNLELELVKILTIFTSIDLSSNIFQGEIPEEVGHLNSLYALNLSHNALTGQIPSVMGNLAQLESLDMSQNKLSGGIPVQLARLTFLSFLNISFNQLEGMIPRGNQFQTFSETSFQGNKGLCGAPLKAMCTDDGVVGSSPPAFEDGNSDSGTGIKWELIGPEIGFVFGLGVVIGPSVFWKRWRKWYWKHVDRCVLKILCCQGRGRGYRGRRANRVTRLRR